MHKKPEEKYEEREGQWGPQTKGSVLTEGAFYLPDVEEPVTSAHLSSQLTLF
jgi:hypothetical protein